MTTDGLQFRLDDPDGVFGANEANDLGAHDVYNDQQVQDAAFTHFREHGFPYRKLPVHVCLQQINELAQMGPRELATTSMAYHVADTYHPHRFHGAAQGKKSPLEAFNEDKLLRRAIRLALASSISVNEQYVSTLSIVSSTQACSNFRPGFACHIYRRFCHTGDVILDTSTGYGGRLVGYIASGVEGRYVGIDPSTETHKGNERMARDLGYADQVELYNLPAEDVPLDVLAGRCDFAFTSPPYFIKERYAEEPTQSWKRYPTAEKWCSGFLEPMLRLQYAALKPGSYSVINVADVNVKGVRYPVTEWVVDAARKAGLRLVRQEAFRMTVRFGAHMADEVATEPLLILRKPTGGADDLPDAPFTPLTTPGPLTARYKRWSRPEALNAPPEPVGEESELDLSEPVTPEDHDEPEESNGHTDRLF